MQPRNGSSNSSTMCSFYKRTLPETCIAFQSPSGREIFKSALNGEYMSSYFLLSAQFLTQSEPAYCGLASLCMILNAFGVDPLRQWKGVWRWYDETMLDCCRPLDLVKVDGITLSEFCCLAQCNGLKATLYRASEWDLEQFINDLKQTCQSDTEAMVLSYSRSVLGQTGQGHYSPVGGFNEKEGKVLILDVARFKYLPYWVSVELLWRSLLPIDPSSNPKQSRGYAILKKTNNFKAYSQLSVDSSTWLELYEPLFIDLPNRLRMLAPSATLYDFAATFVNCIPPEYQSVVENRTLMFSPLGGEVRPESDDAIKSYVSGVDDLLLKVSSTDFYREISTVLKCGRRDFEIDSPVGIHSPASTGRSSLAEGGPKVYQLQRLLSLSAITQRVSITELLTVRDDVDYYTAFLTLFAIALFSFDASLYKNNLRNTNLATLISQAVDVTRPDVPQQICNEVSSIKRQIEALNEFLRDAPKVI